MSQYRDDRLADAGLSLFDPDYPVRCAVLAFLRDEFSGRHGRVLDFGAGNSPYRGFFDCDHYVTADIEQNVDGTIDHILADARLPRAAKGADLVLAFDVLEHVPWLDETLAELNSALNEGGRGAVDQSAVSLPRT